MCLMTGAKNSLWDANIIPLWIRLLSLTKKICRPRLKRKWKELVKPLNPGSLVLGLPLSLHLFHCCWLARMEFDLVGFIYKLFAKVLVIRLNLVMNNLISVNQFMFITCNFQRGYGDEWNHWLEKKLYVKMLIFKVDFEKVCDLVSLGFLDYIL